MKLAVYARDKRRGGLDINPFRMNYNHRCRVTVGGERRSNGPQANILCPPNLNAHALFGL